VKPQGEARNFTWIATELARRTGLLEKFNNAINTGAFGVPLRNDKRDFSLDPTVPHPVDTIWDAVCRAASHELSGGEEVHDLEWIKANGLMSRPYPLSGWYLYPTMKKHNLRFELPYQERLMRAGRELGNRLHEGDIRWWDAQLNEYQPLPVWHDFPGIWEQGLVNKGRKPEEFPFWMIATKSMQYHAGGNVGIQLMDELSQNVRGHGGIMINATTAEKMGVEDGDMLEATSVIGSTQGPTIVVEGIRPDTLVIIDQFGHWATPYAKDLKAPTLNSIAPMSIDLTDATGSGADIVRVSLKRVAQAAHA